MLLPNRMSGTEMGGDSTVYLDGCLVYGTLPKENSAESESMIEFLISRERERERERFG